MVSQKIILPSFYSLLPINNRDREIALRISYKLSKLKKKEKRIKRGKKNKDPIYDFQPPWKSQGCSTCIFSVLWAEAVSSWFGFCLFAFVNISQPGAIQENLDLVEQLSPSYCPVLEPMGHFLVC